MDFYRQRFAETIAWCANKTDVADFRTPELCEAQSNAASLHFYSTFQCKSAVEEVITRRRALLEPHDALIEIDAIVWNKGHVLAFAPHGSLFDGAAEVESNGFFDWNNAPAWDTWICWIDESEPLKKGISSEWQSYLLAWVPKYLVEIVNNGIEVNPEECIMWAAHLETPTIQRLREEHLIW